MIDSKYVRDLRNVPRQVCHGATYGPYRNVHQHVQRTNRQEMNHSLSYMKRRSDRLMVFAGFAWVPGTSQADPLYTVPPLSKVTGPVGLIPDFRRRL